MGKTDGFRLRFSQPTNPIFSRVQVHGAAAEEIHPRA